MCHAPYVMRLHLKCAVSVAHSPPGYLTNYTKPYSLSTAALLILRLTKRRLLSPNCCRTSPAVAKLPQDIGGCRQATTINYSIHRGVFAKTNFSGCACRVNLNPEAAPSPWTAQTKQIEYSCIWQDDVFSDRKHFSALQSIAFMSDLPIQIINCEFLFPMPSGKEIGGHKNQG